MNFYSELYSKNITVKQVYEKKKKKHTSHVHLFFVILLNRKLDDSIKITLVWKYSKVEKKLGAAKMFLKALEKAENIWGR